MRTLVDLRLELASPVGQQSDLDERIGTDFRRRLSVGQIIDRDDVHHQRGERRVVVERKAQLPEPVGWIGLERLLGVEIRLQPTEIVVQVTDGFHSVQARYFHCFNGFHATHGTTDGKRAGRVRRLPNERTGAAEKFGRGVGDAGRLAILVRRQIDVDGGMVVVDRLRHGFVVGDRRRKVRLVGGIRFGHVTAKDRLSARQAIGERLEIREDFGRRQRRA